MSSEKDKRGSKSFGSRFSLIFGDTKSTKSAATSTSTAKTSSTKHTLAKGLHIKPQSSPITSRSINTPPPNPIAPSKAPISKYNAPSTNLSLNHIQPPSNQIPRPIQPPVQQNADPRHTITSINPSKSSDYSLQSALTPVRTPVSNFSPISPPQSSGKARRKPPPEIDSSQGKAERTYNNNRKNTIHQQNPIGEDFQFNTPEAGAGSFGSRLNDPTSNINDNSHFNDLIDDIEDQIDFYNDDGNDTDSGNQQHLSFIPRSPNILQLSHFSDNSTNSLPHSISVSNSNSNDRSDSTTQDLFLKDLESTPSIESQNWSSVSPLKSKFSIHEVSPKKDSFLNFSTPPDQSDTYNLYGEGQDELNSFKSDLAQAGEFEVSRSSGSSENPIIGNDLIEQNPLEDPIDSPYASTPKLSPSVSQVSTPRSSTSSRLSSSPNMTPISVASQNSDLIERNFEAMKFSPVSTPSRQRNRLSSDGSSNFGFPNHRTTSNGYQDIYGGSGRNSYNSRDSYNGPSRDTNNSGGQDLYNIQAQDNFNSGSGSPNFDYSKVAGSQDILTPLSAPIDSGSSNEHRRKASSASSLFSSNSYKPTNLATIKRSLSLKPGEGERSNYVLTIRRSAGTSFNENGPGKWKLPIGIKPMDKASLIANANGKYKRTANYNNNNSSRNKRSGVELKHGHLQPRLLAGEIDDKDTGIRQKLGLEEVKPALVSARNASGVSLGSSVNLARTVTVGSSVTMDSNPVSSVGSTIAESIVSSNSSESIDGGIGGYYQHRGYKYSEGGDDETEVENSSIDGDEAEQPRLVLANPDSGSDSE